MLHRVNSFSNSTLYKELREAVSADQANDKPQIGLYHNRLASNKSI